MVWTAFHAKLHRTLRQQRLLAPGQRLLVSVSGGQDSLSLMQLLVDLQPKWSWDLAIAHCDHRWRQDSQANADHVAQFAKFWQVPFYCQTAVAVPKTEAQAREWRYQVLAQLAQAKDYPVVITGHTASDRAETLLYNLIRGSGADGLQALTWQRSLASTVRLVRPLLEFTRTETAQVCQDLGLSMWEDATNQDCQYARNRIRQELIPYLANHFNPQVEQAVAQTAELLRADVDYLESAAAALRQQAEVPGSGLNCSLLSPAPLALQRRAVRQFLQQALDVALNFDQIEKVVALISAPNRTQTDPLSGNIIARVEDAWIKLKPLP